MAEQISLGLGMPKREPRVMVFDLETLRDAFEVGGWGNIKGMGMACAVVYDSGDERYHVFEEKDVQELVAKLREADLVVGFNHIRFDYTVLSGYTSENFKNFPNFDILNDVERLLGHRLKLNSLVAATLGDQKSADGMQSLQWVKQGRMDLVREYCKKDVEVTKRLFEYGRKEGRVYYSDLSGERVVLPVEWDLSSLIESAQKPRQARPMP